MQAVGADPHLGPEAELGAIGEAGAANAALFAVAMLANEFPEIRERLIAFRQRQTANVLDMALPEEGS